MLECSTCIRRCIRTIFTDVLDSHRPLQHSRQRLLPQHPSRSTWTRRGYATEATSFENRPVQIHPPPAPYVGRSNRPTKQETPFKKKNLEEELRWLKDPLKLATKVVDLLRQDEFQKALELVRLASKDIQCTVSWNHLVDYEMSKGRVTNASKIYNEMKKRAQQPDAHTFTTLFRGFAWHAKVPLSAPRALSIYHSMYNENCPVKPNVIHTNAVLKVCALAGDIDGLLGVAAMLPSRGNGAPNNLTYTTILNAIRMASWNDTKTQENSPAKTERASQAVMQGRRLWEEIRDRWASGDLYIDEELVCAMGRILLLGYEVQDWDDILSLVEQTMGIRRQAPRLGDPARARTLRQMEPSQCREEDIEANVDLQTLLPPPEPSEDELSDSSISAFAPLPGGPPASQAAVRPGRNTLSLLVDACIRLNLVRPAQNYWGILTNPSGKYNITPDSENYHMYLRLLRVQRASRLAVELVEEMKGNQLDTKVHPQTKTFRIALSCCVRDSNNPNALIHAAKLVRMMTDTLPHPDARALSMYLELAMTTQRGDWRALMGVIRGTELGVRNLRSLLAYDLKGLEKQKMEDVMALVKKLIGAFDMVLDLGREEMDQKETVRCREQRHILAAYVTKNVNLEKARERRKKDEERERVGTIDEDEEDEEGDVEVGEDRRIDSRAYTLPGRGSEWRAQHRKEKKVERRERVKRAIARKSESGLKSEQEEW